MAKIVEVTVDGKNLSVFMEVGSSEDGNQPLRLVVDLLKPGTSDDGGAEPIKSAFKFAFGLSYGHEIQMALPKGTVPALWLTEKVALVDKLVEFQEQLPSSKYA